MKIEKSKLTLVLICCFLGAAIFVFLLKSNSNVNLKNRQPSPTVKQRPQDNAANRNGPALRNDAVSDIPKNDKEMEYDDISDLEALLGDIIDGDIGDAMDVVWSSREITCDFSDRSKVAEQVNQFPIVSDIPVLAEQLAQLRNCVTQMIFNNGNDDYESYLSFLRESGETIQAHHGEPLPPNPWKVHAESLRQNKENSGLMSRWEGLVLEGSRIKIFEAHTSNPPLGRDLRRLRGAIRVYGRMTVPPVRADDVLKSEGKILMADVQVFIAHDASTGGVVWPFIIRYWFDPVHSSWRAQQAALFRNRHKDPLIKIIY